jgi:tetratricopeptide (TPR) repeat protein
MPIALDTWYLGSFSNISFSGGLRERGVLGVSLVGTYTTVSKPATLLLLSQDALVTGRCRYHTTSRTQLTTTDRQRHEHSVSPARCIFKRNCTGFLILLVSILLAACQADPTAQKTKFLEGGNQYFKEGKYSAAVIHYRNAIDIDPTWGEARKKLADAYARSGDASQALQQYVRAADLLPNDVDVQVVAGAYLLAASKPQDAIARADAALTIQPQNIQALLLRGNALAGLSSFEDALKAIEEAIRLDPTRGSTFTQLGLVEFARGRRREAEAAFLKAVELAPKSVETHLALGNFYWSVGKAPETEKAFQGAIGADPNSATANRAMAAFSISTGRYRDAEQYLLRLTKSGDPDSVFAVSDYYLASGRVQDAIAQLEALAQTKKEILNVEPRLARAYAVSGDTTHAMTLVERVLARNPSAVDAQLVKGQLLLNEGRKDEAFAAVRAAASSNPQSAEAQFALGRMFASQGDHVAAEAAYREVLRINPRAAAAQLEIAKLQLSEGNLDASLNAAEDIARTQPENVDARLVLVRGLIASKDLQRAEQEITALRIAYPNVTAVHIQSALLSLLKSHIGEARKALERAQTLDPKSIDLLEAWIALDLKSNNPTGARGRIDQRLKSGTNPTLLLLAARTYIATNDQPATERALKRAIEADPALLSAYAMLGQLYMAQKKLDQARTEFETLASKQTKPVGALTMSGIILMTQGQTEQARKRFQDVLTIDPHAMIAANNLAWMRAEAGDDLDVALKLARMAIAQAPNQPEVMDTLGWIYYKKNLLELAIPLFTRCVEKDPSHTMYRYHLGLAYMKAGQTDRGRAALEQVLKTGVDAATAMEANRLLGNSTSRP